MKCLDNLEADVKRLPRMPGSRMEFKVGGKVVAHVTTAPFDGVAPIYLVSSPFIGEPLQFGVERKGVRPTYTVIVSQIRERLSAIVGAACSGIYRDATRSFVEGPEVPAVRKNPQYV